MQRIATVRGTRVRRSITNYFGESTSPQRRSVAIRIVEWLLSRSTRLPTTELCCDECDRVTAGKVIDCTGQVFGQERQRRTFARRLLPDFR